MTITELWRAYNENLDMIAMHRANLDVIKKQIEVKVAQEFGVEQVLMTRISHCPNSPTSFCFTNPNAINPWGCIYCNHDSQRP